VFLFTDIKINQKYTAVGDTPNVFNLLHVWVHLGHYQGSLTK